MPNCVDPKADQSNQREVSTQGRLSGICSKGGTAYDPGKFTLFFASHGMIAAAAIKMAIPR